MKENYAKMFPKILSKIVWTFSLYFLSFWKRRAYSKNNDALVKKVKNIIYYHPVPIWTKVALNVEIKIWKKRHPKGSGTS